LLELAASADRKTQSEVLVDIALILERRRLPKARLDTDYATLLRPNLLSIKIKSDEQIDVVERLSYLAATNRTHPSMLWAIGKAAPEVGIVPLLALLRTRSGDFDEETLYQALMALENFLVTKKGALLPDVAEAIRKDDPTPLLRELSRNENRRIAENAQRVLESLYRKL